MPFAVRPEEGLRQKGLERNREREVTGTKDKTKVELPGQHLERLGLNEKQCIKAGRQRLHVGHSGKGLVWWSTENQDQLGSVQVKEKHCRPGLHEPTGTWTPQMGGPESGVRKDSCHISTGHRC